MLVILLLTACNGGVTTQAFEEILTLSDGTTTKMYTLSDLQALGASQASFNEVAYIGVVLSDLLVDAGFNPGDIRAVKVTAVDNYSVNYEAEIFTRADVLVAYERVDGPLIDDELPFRMVIPDGEGKINVRQIIDILVIP
jgi:hypothetical protein